MPVNETIVTKGFSRIWAIKDIRLVVTCILQNINELIGAELLSPKVTIFLNEKVEQRGEQQVERTGVKWDWERKLSVIVGKKHIPEEEKLSLAELNCSIFVLLSDESSEMRYKMNDYWDHSFAV